MRMPVVVPVVSVSVAVVVDGTAASSATSHRVFAARCGTVNTGSLAMFAAIRRASSRSGNQ